jgi:photosystem II stability/assembly factor-like uncharacterized protein
MMKTLFHLLILFISFNLQAQWEKITLETSASFRGLRKYKNDIWATGTNGTVVHSQDQGKNWEVQKISGAENLDFRDLCIINENIILLMSAGLAEKGQSKIFRSNDGGKNWNIVFEQKEKGIFFDAMQFDPKTKQGLLVSDPVNGQFKFFSFNSNGEIFTAIDLKDFPKLLPREAAFAASGSSLNYQDGVGTLITGGAKNARILQSVKKNLSIWKVKNQEIEADSSSGFFSLGTNGQNVFLVAGGNYLKVNENKIPLLLSQDAGEHWTILDKKPTFYIEKVIWAKPYWVLTGPSETALYDSKKKIWKSLGKSPYHNIIQIDGYLIGVGGKGEIGRYKMK